MSNVEIRYQSSNRDRERIDTFSRDLLTLIQQNASRTVAWCVLPNHYHVLVEAPDIKKLLAGLGRLHGRTSHEWNDEEQARGRKVFFRCTERYMRSDRHFWATVNYVNHNPVHHRYVRLWTDWPWSSAAQYIEQMGRAEAGRVWKEHPIKEYGKKWDPAGP
jgi:putative transposase